MRRIVMLLSVVALMVVMLAMSVAPAFARWDAAGGACRTGDSLVPTSISLGAEAKDRNNDDLACFTIRGGVNNEFAGYYDNRQA